MILSDFEPGPFCIDFEDATIKLKPFTLRCIAWAERFFYLDGINGFERMKKALNNEYGAELYQNAIVDVVYHLGKNEFRNIGYKNAEQLKGKIREDVNITAFVGFLNEIKKIFSECFLQQTERPEPKETGGDLYKKLTAGRRANKQKKTENWDEIYMQFYRSGGMSIDTFLDMTHKQALILYRELLIQNHENLKRLSDVILRKIELKQIHRDPIKFTEEDVSTFEKMHKILLDEKRIN